MTFPFFTNRTPDEMITLLVDIGSASVGVSLIKIEKGRPPHVLASVREAIAFQEVLSSTRFISAMNHSLDKALKSIQSSTKNIGNPREVFCTLSSPWFILKSRHLHIERQEKFNVTERAIDEFIMGDIESLKEELKETLPPKDVKIIEKKIIQMKLNGYESKKPYGQKISQMDIFLTVGISSSLVISSIERKIGNYFHTKSIHFGTFPVAAFSVIRDIFPTENNFIFLDITGEATDISIVNNDILLGTLSFSCGKNFFIREISTKLSTVHEEAITIFSMFLRNELDVQKRAKIEAVVSRAEVEWLARFEKTLKTLAGKGVLPRKVFFTTDADVAPIFSRLIGSVKSEFLVGVSVDTRYLDQLIVANFVSFEKEVQRDPFIVVEALLANKIFTQHK